MECAKTLHPNKKDSRRFLLIQKIGSVAPKDYTPEITIKIFVQLSHELEFI